MDSGCLAALGPRNDRLKLGKLRGHHPFPFRGVSAKPPSLIRLPAIVGSE